MRGEVHLNEHNKVKLLVVVVSAGNHRSVAGDGYRGGDLR
jgi:hypothetical protein